MTRLITFTDQNMTLAAEICRQAALTHNVNQVKIYTPNDIEQKFRKAHETIFNQPRGYGYWLWKPYFIDRELKNLKDGGHLIYCDAGVEIINNVNYILDRMTSDIWLFGNMWQHAHWCKSDVPAAMTSKGWSWASYDKQCQASVIVFRVSKESRQFVKEWLQFCTKPGLIDDSPSKIENHPEFKEHRHDQAILTTLAANYGIGLHWWPAMYNAGNFAYEKTGYSDQYPVIFHHHRMRNNDFSATDELNRFMQSYFKRKYKIAA